MVDDLQRWLADRIPVPPAPDPARKLATLSAILIPTMRYTVVGSPLGDVYIAYTEAGIAFLRFEVRVESEFLAALQQRYGATAARDDTRQAVLARQVAAWTAGKPVRPRLDLSRLSPWEQQVLTGVVRIGRGKVRPYSWVARELGRAQASRAVGQAVAHNPIPLFIPCHRVIPAAGGVGNYAYGGTPVKERLLAAEGVDTARLEELAAQGLRFEGSRTTHIFCIPGCHHIQPQHRVDFPSAAAAAQAGYRPCKVCRPA